MREIKFRAWTGKYMIHSEYGAWVSFDGVIYKEADKHYNTPNIEIQNDRAKPILMQFTGLKDNEGKEYYFDDIVRFPNDSIGVLVWMGDCLGIGSGEINNYHAIDQVRDIELSDCRIIGNIHQNPDLLS